MDVESIVRMAENAGLHVLGIGDGNIYIEDPTCLMRTFDTFLDYAWIAMLCVTILLLTGWALTMIRGAKNDLAINFRNLVLIFGAISAIKPTIDVIYGDDLFARGCDRVAVSIANANQILDLRRAQLKDGELAALYENMEIFDSGPDAPAQNADELPAFNPDAADELQNIPDPDQTTDIPKPVPISAPFVPDRPSYDPISGNIEANSSTLPPLANQSTAYAEGRNGSVYYYLSPTNKFIHSGGSPAWRNTNPGNLRPTAFSRSVGAIGHANGFAVFPDVATAVNAMRRLLLSKSYRNLTINQAIARWAPAFENDTAGYQSHVRRMTGLDPNRVISSLNETELTAVINAIRRVEGWKPGRVTRL